MSTRSHHLDPVDPVDSGAFGLRVVLVIAAALVGLMMVAGCGDSDDGSADGGDGPVSVEEIVNTGKTGEMEVRAILFDDGNGLVLCGVLAESFPPQCPGPSIPITNPEAVDVVITEEGRVRWTDRATTLTGVMTDGSFEISS